MTAGSAPNRQWIIQWRGQHFSTDTVASGETLNFGIVFNEASNAFAYVYQTVGGAGANAGGGQATVGVQAASNGTVFTRFSFNSRRWPPAAGSPRRSRSARQAPGACVLPDPLFSNGFEP